MFLDTKKDGEAPTTARSVLLKAAELIEKNGRTIGCLGGEQIGFCMIGAIAFAITGKADGSVGEVGIEAFRRVEEAIGTYNVGRWNDSHTTSEALAALRKAAG